MQSTGVGRNRREFHAGTVPGHWSLSNRISDREVICLTYSTPVGNDIGIHFKNIDVRDLRGSCGGIRFLPHYPHSSEAIFTGTSST